MSTKVDLCSYDSNAGENESEMSDDDADTDDISSLVWMVGVPHLVEVFP